jgi:separase
VESVKAFPYGLSGLEHLARSATSTNAFSANASTKQLGGIIDRLTYAATCELFLPTSEVSLHTALKPGFISDEVLGLLLERQISILEPCLRKDGVQTIVRGLLRDALSVYKATVLPLRRARVLLKCMELLWKDGNINGGETCWTAEHLGEEVLNLLTVEVTLCLVSASGCYNFSIPGPWTRLRLCSIPLTVHCGGPSLVEPLRVS